MPHDEIAKGLRLSRTSKKYTVNQMVEKLKHKGVDISAKTIYGWESGRRQPDADTLMLWCEICEVKDIMSLFGYDNEIENMTDEEVDAAIKETAEEAVEIFNSLSPELQQAALEILEILKKVARS